MQIIIDLDLREAVSDFSVKSPAPPYVGKSQDTQAMEIYFVESGAIQDLGTGPAIKYGLIGPGGPSLLVLCTSFTRQIDVNGNVFYLGFPLFNTSNLASALGSNTSIACISEVRYQLSSGEIEHTLDIPITVFRTILSEITSDTTTAAFIAPAVGANVTIAIGNTAWLQVGQQLTIATAGIYQVISITDGTHFVAQNTGQPGNATSGTNIPSGSSVAGAPVNALTTYPPSNTLELISTRDIASGHAGLDASAHLTPSVIPIDGVTIQILDGQLATAPILAETAASFVTPAANATVSVTLVSSAGLVAGQYVRLPIAGYYIVQSTPDGTHAVLQNNGDPANAASGVTIVTDTPLLPAQAAAGGGSGTPGQNAYTLTTAGFTVPAAGATVSVAMTSTAWLGGNGYFVFITGAGYYAVNSITDATHALLTNTGSASNAPPGTTVPTSSQVAAAGPSGPAGASGAGLAAYDALTSAFTMPAVSGTVTIVIGNTAWLSVSQIIYIASAGYFRVSSISSATQVLITNLNYPGNATATTTIAAGSNVSPGGLQGPQGAGGPGLNAFTTLSANFTQPTIGATVTVNVGTTAWMAAGQQIFIQGGGYYNVSSISDITHALVTNLGGSANIAAGSTVTGSGTQNVTPAGTPGVAGTSAYTTTSASFNMPTSGATVTVNVGASAWMAQGQILYLPAAGYFSVSSITDATHVVLTNLGYTGNATAGTVIASGSAVVASGVQGPAGTGGGGGGTLTDATTATGYSWISNPAGILKRVAAGSSNITIADSGSVLTVDAPGAGGGGGMLSRLTAVELFDDFVGGINTAPTTSGTLGWFFIQDSGSGSNLTAFDQSGTTNPELGVWRLSSQNSGTTSIARLGLGPSAAGNAIAASKVGTLIAEWRVAQAQLNTAGTAYAEFRYGINGSATNVSFWSAAFFLYNVNISANWQCYAYNGTNYTTADSGVAVVANAYKKLTITMNATWTTATFAIDGTTVATLTSVSWAAATGWMPMATVGLKAGATIWSANLDWFYAKYSVSR